MLSAFAIVVNGDWILAHPAREARGFLSRGLGWMFRSHPGEGAALVFRSCSSLHTFGMRFALDILFLDEGLRVLAVRLSVAPGRAVMGPRGTRWALEMPASARVERLRVGDTLSFTPL